MSLGNFPDFLLKFSGHKMNGAESHSYCFNSFRLDVEERRLSQNGVAVPLEPKVFDVLAALVQRSGHLVEKDELLHLVWADSFVEEANVARSIYTLRKVLGKDEHSNKFIETVAKKGYRFVAEVTEDRGHTERRVDKLEKPPAVDADFPDTIDADEITATVNQTVPPEPLIEHKRPTRVVFFTVGFATAISLLLLLSFNFWPRAGANPSKTRSIAVLPVKPINSANRDEIYEVGIADSLIMRISLVKGFVVRPLSATRKYADIDQDALAAGKEQQVDYVLASNYQLADGKIRVTSQLFNVATGQIDETKIIEKDAGNIFAAQDAISSEVGNILQARFSNTSISPAAKRGTDNEEAYRLYLLAMTLSDERKGKGKKAIESFEQAIALDPNYALAWAGKANAQKGDYKESIEAADKALALDPDLSEAHSAYCWNKFVYEYDFAGAERECRRAVELNPNSTVAHNNYSSFLISRGRFDEAIAEIKTAIDLDPNSYFNQRVYANCLYFARRYEEAVPQYKRMIEMNEDAPATYQWLIRTLEAQGNESEAFEWFLKSLTLQKQDNETIQRFKTAYQRAGWHGVLLERDRNPDDGNYFRRAGFNARLGNKDKAFEYLERSYQEHGWLVSFLQVEPQLDSLRDDPRYDELVKRIGLK